MQREVFTIGHSTRSIGEFIGMLQAAGVEQIADVRRFPGSRRHPQFGAEALAGSLQARGIAYRHFPELGGRRGKPAADSPNTGWRVQAFQAYADHMAESEWLDALAALEEAATERGSAMLCAEALPWRCHRRLISDALVTRGWRVRHLMGGGRDDEHVLQDFARVLPGGRIIYPAPG